MTGTIAQIRGKKATFCLIEAEDKTIFFAHRKRFLNPNEMLLGQFVQFQPIPAQPGKRYPAAIQVQAA